LRLKKIKNYMILMENVYMISEDRTFDATMLKELEEHNYSKVPVYSKHRFNVLGYIKLKNLLVFKFKELTSLKNSGIIQHIAKLNENLTLLDAIDQLKGKNINFAIVYDKDNKATGMITLKKIFEKLVLR